MAREGGPSTTFAAARCLVVDGGPAPAMTGWAVSESQRQRGLVSVESRIAAGHRPSRCIKFAVWLPPQARASVLRRSPLRHVRRTSRFRTLPAFGTESVAQL